MTVTIHNQVEPFLYTVKVEEERGRCEARNLPYEAALAYVAAQTSGHSTDARQGDGN